MIIDFSQKNLKFPDVCSIIIQIGEFPFFFKKYTEYRSE